MDFDNSSPIWRQLLAEFARRIVTGEWPAGSKMPGVRELAADLGVNPNTAQRALAELERQRLCRSERTSGRYVTDDHARIDETRADLVRDAADSFVERARGYRMLQPQAQDLIAERWNHHHDHADDTGAGGV